MSGCMSFDTLKKRALQHQGSCLYSGVISILCSDINRLVYNAPDLAKSPEEIDTFTRSLINGADIREAALLIRLAGVSVPVWMTKGDFYADYDDNGNWCIYRKGDL